MKWCHIGNSLYFYTLYRGSETSNVGIFFNSRKWHFQDFPLCSSMPITVKGFTMADQLRNENIRNELGRSIFLLYENSTEYRYKYKMHLQRMKQSRIPFQVYKYHPACRRDIGTPIRR
jgi:hypothetical protein